MAPPKLHGRVRIGLPELHGRIRMVWPKLHGRFRMVWPKLHGRFRMVWPKFGILYWDSIFSHQICTVGVFWHTLSIMQEKHWKNLFEIECDLLLPAGTASHRMGIGIFANITRDVPSGRKESDPALWVGSIYSADHQWWLWKESWLWHKLGGGTRWWH